MRRFLSPLLATAVLMLAAAPVLAVPPDRYASDLQDFELSGLCEFDVGFEILVDRFHATDFYDQDGNLVRTNYNGSIRIRVTNLSDPDTWVDLNVGGPGRDIYNDDGTVTALYLGLGIPLLTDSNLTRGYFEFVFSADFSEVTATASHGFTEDLCALLTTD
jgi:hypothetical protein